MLTDLGRSFGDPSQISGPVCVEVDRRSAVAAVAAWAASSSAQAVAACDLKRLKHSKRRRATSDRCKATKCNAAEAKGRGRSFANEDVTNRLDALLTTEPIRANASRYSASCKFSETDSDLHFDNAWIRIERNRPVRTAVTVRAALL